mmetsp:Transcript_3143/g.10133  ORF Transcript_3143/g.10133 Transcript_3143/m.10133 type:complete len:270 (+) Transcript_3143:26-835(+)
MRACGHANVLPYPSSDAYASVFRHNLLSATVSSHERLVFVLVPLAGQAAIQGRPALHEEAEGERAGPAGRPRPPAPAALLGQDRRREAEAPRRRGRRRGAPAAELIPQTPESLLHLGAVRPPLGLCVGAGKRYLRELPSQARGPRGRGVQGLQCPLQRVRHVRLSGLQRSAGWRPGRIPVLRCAGRRSEEQLQHEHPELLHALPLSGLAARGLAEGRAGRRQLRRVVARLAPVRRTGRAGAGGTAKNYLCHSLCIEQNVAGPDAAPQPR